MNIFYNMVYTFIRLAHRQVIYLRQEMLKTYLNQRGHSIAPTVTIKAGVSISCAPGSKLVIKDNVILDKNLEIVLAEKANLLIDSGSYIGKNSVLGSSKKIYIGKKCQISHQVTIIDSDHAYESKDIPIFDQGKTLGEISIEDDCWIGATATILKNTHLRQRTIIGANSLVRGHHDGSCLLAGVPAKRIKAI